MKKTIFARDSVLIGLLFVMATGMVFGGGGSQSAGSGGASGTKTYNGIDVSTQQTIRMYLLGDKPKDFDVVYAEINKRLQEKLNATVSVSFLSWAEHGQKYPLLFSGGEDFDLIFTAAQWAHYETTAAMGGFYALTSDFIQKYAPGIKATVPQVGWDQAAIAGKIYMIPQYQNEFNADVVALRGDVMAKYGYADMTSLNQLIEFYGKVAADQSSTGLSPMGNASGGLLYDYFRQNGMAVMPGSISEFFIYNTQNPSDTKVTYLLDWSVFEQYCQAMKTYYEQGFWSKDSLASTDQRQDGLLRGTSVSMGWNLGSVKSFVDEANKAHPTWNINMYDLYSNMPKGVKPYINNGMAINAASKKKERAMMVLDLLYADKEIHDLALYGIEGTHWKPVGDDQYEKLAKSADFSPGAYCNWGWNNQNLSRTEYIANPTPVDLKATALEADWNKNVKPDHVFDGFSFDKSNITSEVAMVESIVAEYYTPLISGMAGDVPTAIRALRTQVENAGIQKIINEFNTQAAAFVAARK
jgi:putative aldouronate transport system substrate-binding protein